MAQIILTLVFYAWLFAVLAIGMVMWRHMFISARSLHTIMRLMEISITKNTEAITQFTQFKDRLVTAIINLNKTADRVIELEQQQKEFMRAHEEQDVSP